MKICFLTAVVMALLAAGCDMIAHSGAPPQVTRSYYPPGRLQYRPTLGMTLLRVDANDEMGLSNAALAERATDQLEGFLTKSNRFEIIGREAFARMLQEQGHADIIRPGEFLKPADVQGAAYVLVGSVTDLRIGKKMTPGAMKKLAGAVKSAASEKETIVHAQCTVALEFIEPQTGAVVVTNTVEFNQTRSALDMGIDILPSARPSDTGEYAVTNEDRQQVIKLALDVAVQQSLPKFDRFLESGGPRQPTTVGSATTKPASQSTVAATVLCKVCGAETDESAQFCKKCGAKLK